MTDTALHHVVFCVRPENQDKAATFWRDLGLTFEEIALAEEGLRVLLAWSAGIEIISPTAAGGTESDRFLAFLDSNGEGVYSVVVRTAEIEDPVRAAGRHDASVQYRQHREFGEYVVDEVEMTAVHGMPVTFLATNLPD